MFEANDYIGGHTNTVTVELPDAHGGVETQHIDTGFIVYNERNYPNFVQLLDQLAVPTQPSPMNFSVSDPRIGLEYRGTNLNTLYAQRENLAKPWFHRMLVDIVRFNRAARRLLTDAGRTTEPTPVTSCPWPTSWPGAATPPRSWTASSSRSGRRSGRPTRRPSPRSRPPPTPASWTTTGCWSCRACPSGARSPEAPAATSRRSPPRWPTGSACTPRCARSCGATDGQGGIEIELMSPTHGLEHFDRVILACHSDQALRLLSDAGDAERSILGAIGYQPNVATLHTDERFLPRNPRARASWNYHLGTGAGRAATLTYWMNQLQALDSPHQFLVTLNRHDEIDPDAVLARFDYDHPVFDAGAMTGPGPPPRDPGSQRHLLRRRLLGVRLPRGRRPLRPRRVPSLRSGPVSGPVTIPVPSPA